MCLITCDSCCILLLHLQSKFLSVVSPNTKASTTSVPDTKQSSSDPVTCAWRFGPAKVWYDAVGLAEDGRGLDYGFKFRVCLFYERMHRHDTALSEGTRNKT